MLLWLVALQAMSVAPAGPPHSPAVPDDPRYARCAGAERILAEGGHLSWAPVTTAIDRHRKLRAELKASPPPERAPRILWYASGGDLATTSFSIVASRDPGGLWHVDGVGESQIWLPNAKPTVTPPIARTLTAEDSRSLDALLADPCLEIGPTFVDNPRVVAGGLFATLEIDLPGHRWAGAWHGMTTPQEQAILEMIGRP